MRIAVERRATDRLLGAVLGLVLLGCEGEPEQLGICDFFPTTVPVSTEDGSATIAGVETSGVCVQRAGPCFPPAPDGGAGGGGCSVVTLSTTGAGGCDLTIVATDGQRVSAHVEFERKTIETRCRTSVGQVITSAPVIMARPSQVTVNFPRRDAATRD